MKEMLRRKNFLFMLTRYLFAVIPMLALVSMGCEDDPYDQKPVGIPELGKGQYSGSSQQVYQPSNRRSAPAKRKTPTGPVSRQKVLLGKNPMIYGDVNAPVTLVEYSDFQ